MGRGRRCSECGAVGARQGTGLCRPCEIGKEKGPEARQDYFRRLAEKGAKASREAQNKGLPLDELPALEDHASVKAWLTALAEGVAAGRVGKGLSAEVRKILKTWVKVHRQEVTDEVVGEIQQELAELRARLEGGSEPWRRG